MDLSVEYHLKIMQILKLKDKIEAYKINIIQREIKIMIRKLNSTNLNHRHLRVGESWLNKI